MTLTQAARTARLARPNVPAITCAHCTTAFVPNVRSQKHCTIECRRKGMWRARKGARPPKVCAFCSVEFRPARSYKQMYCTVSCREAAKRAAVRSDPERHTRHLAWMREHSKTPRYRLAQANFKARRRAAERAGFVSLSAWRWIVARFSGQCAYCKRSDLPLTMDHVVPLAADGEHVPENVAPACRSCNSAKNDRDWSDRLDPTLYPYPPDAFADSGEVA